MTKCEQCIVREISSLKVLNKEELLSLSNCKVTKLIKKGELIFEEGELINGAYCVKEGVCKMTILSPNGKDQIVKLIKRGELLGQRSIISDEPTNLSAIALEDMEICYIPKGEIVDFFNNNNHFSMQVMKTVCTDLKDADDLMVRMAQKTVKQRLAHMLLYLEETFGTNEDLSLKIQLSRDDIASLIGTATESCIRLLSEFNKLGLILLKGKSITILKRDKLKQLAEA